MRRLRQLAKPLLAIPIIVALASPALADTIETNNDGDAAIGETPDDRRIVYGQVCATTGTDGINGGNHKAIALYIDRGNNNNTTQTFGNSSAVTFSRASSSDAEFGISFATAAGEADPAKLTTTSSWVTSGTTVGPLPATVTLSNVPTGVVTSGLYGLFVDATGNNNASPATTITRTTNELYIHGTTVVNETYSGGTIDCTKPTINITNPVSGTPEYVQHSTHNAGYTCSDASSPNGAAASGVASCTGTVGAAVVASGTALPTAVLGSHTLTVTAVDNAGNVSTATADYTVVAPSAATYTASFKQPLDSGGVINKAKLGRTIPVKVEVLSGTDEDRDGPVYLGATKTSCTTGAGTDSVETYATGGSNDGNAFRWDAAGDFWIHNLDTSKLPGATANACYRVDVFRGGTISSAGLGSGGTQIGSVTIQLFK